MICMKHLLTKQEVIFMKLSYKFLSTAAVAALVAPVAAFAAPTVSEAAAVTVDYVVIDVSGTQVAVNTTTYGEVLLGLNPQLETYLKDGKDTPKVTALKVGGKYVDLTAYGTELLLNGGDTAKAAADTPVISTNGFKEFKEFGTDGKPVFKGDTTPVEGDLEVIDISAVTPKTVDFTVKG